MTQENCGCRWLESSIYGPGGLELCDYHAARTCADCGATDEMPYEDGLCAECAPEEAECVRCHKVTPKRFIASWGECFACLEIQHEAAS